MTAILDAPVEEIARTPKRAKVLIVDDSRVINQLLSELLRHDFDTVSAFDGEQALRLAAEEQPDVVITDIMMPGLTGVEMVAELRRNPALATIPILAISSNASDGLRAQMDAFGVALLSKPLRVENLREHVRRLVADRDGRNK